MKVSDTFIKYSSGKGTLELKIGNIETAEADALVVPANPLLYSRHDIDGIQKSVYFAGGSYGFKKVAEHGNIFRSILALDMDENPSDIENLALIEMRVNKAYIEGLDKNTSKRILNLLKNDPEHIKRYFFRNNSNIVSNAGRILYDYMIHAICLNLDHEYSADMEKTAYNALLTASELGNGDAGAMNIATDLYQEPLYETVKSVNFGYECPEHKDYRESVLYPMINGIHKYLTENDNLMDVSIFFANYILFAQGMRFMDKDERFKTLESSDFL